MGDNDGVFTMWCKAALVLPILALGSFVTSPSHMGLSLSLDFGLFQGRLGYGETYTQSASNFPPTLSYFDGQGRAEVVRLALHDHGVLFLDETFTPDQWGKTKPDGLKAKMIKEGKLAFGQVPLLSVPQPWGKPDLHIVQSTAILRYLGRRLGFYQGSAGELMRVDVAIDGIEDVRGQLMGIKYGGGTDEEKDTKYEEYFSNADKALKWLGYYEAMLTNSSTGFVARTKSVSAADYLLLALIDNHMSLQSARMTALFVKLPQLSAFAERMRARPRLAAYLASPARRTV